MTDQTPEEKAGPVSEPEAETPAPVQEPAPPAAEVLVGILTAPGETFKRIAGKAGWACLIPLVILMILGTAGGFIYLQRADLAEVIRQQIKQNPRAAEMSEAQMDQAVEMGSRIGKAMTYAGFLVVTVKYLIVAAILWLVVLAFGDTITFPDTFRVVCWSQLPNILFTLLFIVMMFVKDATYLDPNNPVMSNLGAVFGQERLGKVGYAFLSDLDVFTLWMLWLYTRGLAAFANAKVGKMAAIVFGLYGIPVVLHLAKAAIF